ncbi:hypothetical protein V6N11_069951 [Hibiscus sabdariffa]|uniref:Uncharacterized protein n=1 Tax=Hibiscus sabdariffa TaxID=183260 RepID=A0ABR2QDZ6_9ROSI
MAAETRFHSCISLHFLLFYVDGGGVRKGIEGMVVRIVGIKGKLGSGGRVTFGSLGKLRMLGSGGSEPSFNTVVLHKEIVSLVPRSVAQVVENTGIVKQGNHPVVNIIGGDILHLGKGKHSGSNNEPIKKPFRGVIKQPLYKKKYVLLKPPERVTLSDWIPMMTRNVDAMANNLVNQDLPVENLEKTPSSEQLVHEHTHVADVSTKELVIIDSSSREATSLRA